MECGEVIEITTYEDDTYKGNHYFGEFTIPDEDSEEEYEKTGEWKGHDVVKWTGGEESYEYWSATTAIVLLTNSLIVLASVPMDEDGLTDGRRP
ncbi:hypothetical protein [Halalkalicoccus jeotgali]|uniref:Uncharacterized protein n=1 Tax=Halalkalicoccus jeotgali (strain DSM 18796 / CECT 7217 / JCM 14584 / KCTC 4019 / B3) TaxID=795797 RepID=D8JCA4_HALJB|nr:hypothetical protein [Halalkalicoccus jeotgali]ADJ17011.1 hypothetical protein HacjB3_18343 [Halalkalicoccus jeotgali B3]ELY38826.1 hypothetical protein C497_06574 [Halalkalicoccus jeotgali B3]